jgi:hypothetical protein
MVRLSTRIGVGEHAFACMLKVSNGATAPGGVPAVDPYRHRRDVAALGIMGTSNRSTARLRNHRHPALGHRTPAEYAAAAAMHSACLPKACGKRCCSALLVVHSLEWSRMKRAPPRARVSRLLP